MQETNERQVQSLGQEDPLEEGDLQEYSSILARRIPCTEMLGRLQSIASQSDMTEATARTYSKVLQLYKYVRIHCIAGIRPHAVLTYQTRNGSPVSTKPLNFLGQVTISSLCFSIYSAVHCALVRSQILFLAIQSLFET